MILADVIQTLLLEHRKLFDETCLKNNDFLWLESGAIDCFVRERSEHSEHGGALIHVFRVEVGQLCPVSECLPEGMRGDYCDQLVWSLLPNAVCWQLDGEELLHAVKKQQAFSVFEDALAHWLDNSSKAHIHTAAPSLYQDIVNAEEDEQSLAPDQALSTANRIACLQLKSGEMNWAGNVSAVLNVDDEEIIDLLVHRRHWLITASDCEYQCVSMQVLVDNGGFFKAIQNYYRVLFLQTASAQELLQERSHSQQKARALSRLQLTSKAVQNLADVMRGNSFTAPQGTQSLEGSLRHLEAILGIDFKLDDQQSLLQSNEDVLEEICAYSNVRKRQVALKDEWWLRDGGPLLLREENTAHWYCAVPQRKGGYVIHNSIDGSMHRMNEDWAEKLSSFGSSFYRSFENKQLNPLDVLKFGLRGLKNDIVLILSVGVITGLLGMLMPIATGKIVESVIPSGHEPTLWAFAAALMTAMIAGMLFDLTSSIAQLRVESKMDGSVQAAVWDRVLKLPTRFFRQYSAGDLSDRIGAINEIRSALSGMTISTLMSSLFSSFNLILLFYYDSKLAMIACALVLGAVLILLGVGYLKLKYERQIAEQEGRLSSLVFEYLSGINKLRSAAAENRAFYNWSERFAKVQRLSFKAEQLDNMDDTLFAGYGLFTTAVIFAAVGAAISSGSREAMSIGQFIAFNAAFGAFFGGVMSLSDTLLELVELIPIYERAKPILQGTPENYGDKCPPEAIKGHIDIARLHFAYPDSSAVIHDLSLSIRAGEFVALVGTSGSGKSTLLRLLLGFEVPTEGSIHYDSQDMTQLDLNALRRNMGVVLQGGQLLAGDIFQNIVGSHPLTLDDAWEAAEMVGLDEDIRKMPMGMHTIISEGASTLSGGQRQRILIARAIVTRPRILLFDEATSALDNKTQAVVSRSLENLKATRVVIAHRLSTIMNADRIVVLDKGRIVQQGNYSELMREEGAFKLLASRQLT